MPLHINTDKLYRGMQLATEALLGLRQEWAEERLGEFTFDLQLGRGRRTYLQHSQASGPAKLLKRSKISHGFKLVYGRRCIEEIFDAGHYHRWKSFAELKNNLDDKHQGPLTPLQHLSHIVLHEFSHFVQSVLGQRYNRSVHNPEFYQILASSYAAGSEQLVMTHILKACEDCPQTMTALHTSYGSRLLPAPPADACTTHGFQRGQKVSFVYRTQPYTGTITRLNKQRASVTCQNADFPRALIPYAQLTEVISE